MSVRLLMTDEAWAQIESVLDGIKSKAGNPPVLSDRMFVEAVLYQARAGSPWRDFSAISSNIAGLRPAMTS